MNIYVNADDLGMTQAINDQSFDLIARGLVTSASVIANSPYAEESMRRARLHPECAFGIHLNVSQFSPLRPCADIQPLLQPDGEFLYNALSQVPKTPSLKYAIYREWSAQIERCLALGLEPTHLDSHHHVHMMPELFLSLKRLQWRFGIKRIRTSVGFNKPRLRTLLRTRLWAFAVRLDGTDSTDCLGSLMDFHRALQAGVLPRRVMSSRRTAIELMVHPGNDFHPDFLAEIELLRSGWLEGIHRYGVECSQPARNIRRRRSVGKLAPGAKAE
jgi:predicted glycoside hydrolase/deacetylase ChbG (UPF0249 family)